MIESLNKVRMKQVCLYLFPPSFSFTKLSLSTFFFLILHCRYYFSNDFICEVQYEGIGQVTAPL